MTERKRDKGEQRHINVLNVVMKYEGDADAGGGGGSWGAGVGAHGV